MPYPTQAGQVGGHEGVGIVHKLGPGSENGRTKVGDRVGIKASKSLGYEICHGTDSRTVDCICLWRLPSLSRK